MKRYITALFLILIPVAFNVVFFALGSTFSYPDILRQPTDAILQQFVAGGAGLVTLWYLFAVIALLAIPLALFLYTVFQEDHPYLAYAATITGVLSGLVQAIGLFRWVFLVPSLATTYMDATVDPVTRAAAVVAFEVAHNYLGVAVGEHLGYIFTGTWTILLGVMMFKSRTFPTWLGIVGIIAAIGIMTGLLEPAGWAPAGMINAVSYIMWSSWLVMMGIILLVRPNTRMQARSTSMAS
ncbi:MAG: DUF4386 domain-containing protein [Chloroflexi bacterium AL-W]|nr:DUF4386 domain-containing protein [Chloroflexi bacterium AL-N1]NOK69262.1 DUF4386 domain-containing protein [Chloroflexi bacterium AL-N10]NOK76323.1 DUF4386 domain-containing protein [Chloroflexi bacterium AL-N5]NOK83440.1 DUF4386 domain-containing protein [Chloroflexi bacterium AL-W]NOK91100.1 DUF4386 domain-containing protein [Chloroflexi bacterium AL-N15]